MSTASKVGMQQNLWNCVHPLGRQCHSTSSDQPRVVVASQGAPWWASSSYMSWHSGLWSHSSGGKARVVICAMSTMCGKGVVVLITTLLPQLLVEAEPEAEPDAEPMMSSFNSPSNSLYTYRTLPPPTMMQMASESPSSFSNSDNTRYTTARPLFIPNKATTLQSPIYYPESPALPQYYPGPLTSGSERWRWSKMEDFNLLLSNFDKYRNKNSLQPDAALCWRMSVRMRYSWLVKHHLPTTSTTTTSTTVTSTTATRIMPGTTLVSTKLPAKLVKLRRRRFAQRWFISSSKSFFIIINQPTVALLVFIVVIWRSWRLSAVLQLQQNAGSIIIITFIITKSSNNHHQNTMQVQALPWLPLIGSIIIIVIIIIPATFIATTQGVSGDGLQQGGGAEGLCTGWKNMLDSVDTLLLFWSAGQCRMWNGRRGGVQDSVWATGETLKTNKKNR